MYDTDFGLVGNDVHANFKEQSLNKEADWRVLGYSQCPYLGCSVFAGDRPSTCTGRHIEWEFVFGLRPRAADVSRLRAVKFLRSL